MSISYDINRFDEDPPHHASKRELFQSRLAPVVTKFSKTPITKIVLDSPVQPRDRRDLIILRLMDLLQKNGVDHNLYRNVVCEPFFSDDEIQQLSEEMRIPLFRHIFENRCSKDFVNCGKIGSGGFGSVFKMIHRIDQQKYAIKKIPFHFRNVEHLRRLYNSIIREVRTLASTDHVGIVHYHSCWFEPYSRDFEEKMDNRNVGGTFDGDYGEASGELQFSLEDIDVEEPNEQEGDILKEVKRVKNPFYFSNRVDSPSSLNLPKNIGTDFNDFDKEDSGDSEIYFDHPKPSTETDYFPGPTRSIPITKKKRRNPDDFNMIPPSLDDRFHDLGNRQSNRSSVSSASSSPDRRNIPFPRTPPTGFDSNCSPPSGPPSPERNKSFKNDREKGEDGEDDVDLFNDSVPAVGIPVSPAGRREYLSEMYHYQQQQGQRHRGRRSTGGGGGSSSEFGWRKKLDGVSPATPLLNHLYSEEKDRYEMVLFIQMQLCSPCTLVDYLWSNKRVSGEHEIDYDTCICFFYQIVQALIHIHEKGLVHRDIKPSNIFMFKDNTLKLGDFGLAKFVNEEVERYEVFSPPTSISSTNGSSQHHHEGGEGSGRAGLGEKSISSNELEQYVNSHSDCDPYDMYQSNDPLSPMSTATAASTTSQHTENIGTWSYASPEQLRGDNYDEKADIFSLGIILFELFRPFSTRSERVEVIRNLRRTRKVSKMMMSQYPEEMKIVERCLLENPKDRPSAGQIALFVDTKYRAKVSYQHMLSQILSSSFGGGKGNSARFGFSSLDGEDVVCDRKSNNNNNNDEPTSEKDKIIKKQKDEILKLKKELEKLKTGRKSPLKKSSSKKNRRRKNIKKITTTTTTTTTRPDDISIDSFFRSSSDEQQQQQQHYQYQENKEEGETRVDTPTSPAGSPVSPILKNKKKRKKKNKHGYHKKLKKKKKKKKKKVKVNKSPAIKEKEEPLENIFSSPSSLQSITVIENDMF